MTLYSIQQISPDKASSLLTRVVTKVPRVNAERFQQIVQIRTLDAGIFLVLQAIGMESGIGPIPLCVLPVILGQPKAFG